MCVWVCSLCEAVCRVHLHVNQQNWKKKKSAWSACAWVYCNLQSTRPTQRCLYSNIINFSIHICVMHFILVSIFMEKRRKVNGRVVEREKRDDDIFDAFPSFVREFSQVEAFQMEFLTHLLPHHPFIHRLFSTTRLRNYQTVIDSSHNSYGIHIIKCVQSIFIHSFRPQGDPCL